MADPDRPTLEVEERSERGSRAARRLRRSGQVPGVLYGGTGAETVSFKVGERSLRNVLGDGAALIDIKVGGGAAKPVILKDQQKHPVRDDYVHVDFLEVRLDEKIHAEVHIELEGGEEAPGVKEGGVVEHVTREIGIEALPTDIPERIVADISQMDIAATLTLAELDMPAGVTLLDENPEEVTIATVVVPTEIEEPEVEEEPVLIGEDGEPIEVPEGEEAPEGEEPAEGEGEGERDSGGDSGGGDSGGDEG